MSGTKFNKAGLSFRSRRDHYCPNCEIRVAVKKVGQDAIITTCEFCHGSYKIIEEVTPTKDRVTVNIDFNTDLWVNVEPAPHIQRKNNNQVKRLESFL